MDNTICLIGNVTRDPELRYLPNGSPNVQFGLAVNRRWQNKQTQQWEEQVSFFEVTVWGEMAENVAASCPKGCRVIVQGRLQQRSWEGDDGKKNYKIEVVADEVGPSVRWAEAVVTRNERQQGNRPQEKQGASVGYDGGPDFG